MRKVRGSLEKLHGKCPDEMINKACLLFVCLFLCTISSLLLTISSALVVGTWITHVVCPCLLSSV